MIDFKTIWLLFIVIPGDPEEKLMGGSNIESVCREIGVQQEKEFATRGISISWRCKKRIRL